MNDSIVENLLPSRIWTDFLHLRFLRNFRKESKGTLQAPFGDRIEEHNTVNGNRREMELKSFARQLKENILDDCSSCHCQNKNYFVRNNGIVMPCEGNKYVSEECSAKCHCHVVNKTFGNCLSNDPENCGQSEVTKTNMMLISSYCCKLCISKCYESSKHNKDTILHSSTYQFNNKIDVCKFTTTRKRVNHHLCTLKKNSGLNQIPSAVSHLFSGSKKFSILQLNGESKQKLTILLKQLLFVLIVALAIMPASAKGPGEPSMTNNVFGGFASVGNDHMLFLQSNHTTTKAQSGATAALHCALASPLADGLVSWVRRRDYHLLTVGRQVYSSDQRMGVKVSPDGRDWMLTIRWVNPEDAGQYECQVSSHPPQSLMVNLSVVDAHAEILGGKERYIHSGSSLRLVCLLRDATEPPVYVFWYRGNRMINYDTERGVSVDNSREASVLYVTSVVGHDEGNYTCMPSNAAPASVMVHVVKRENPAGLQQETSSEKDSKNPASSSSPVSSSQKILTKSNNCCGNSRSEFWTINLGLLIYSLQSIFVNLR